MTPWSGTTALRAESLSERRHRHRDRPVWFGFDVVSFAIYVGAGILEKIHKHSVNDEQYFFGKESRQPRAGQRV